MSFTDRYLDMDKKCADGSRPIKVGKLALHIIAAIIFVFIALIIALNSYTVVPAGQIKVKSVFGKVNENTLSEGFHVVNPLAEFSVYDTRNQTLAIDNIMVPSQDKLKTDMDVSIIYRIDKGSVVSLKKEVGSLDDFNTKYLLPKARSVLREVGKGVENSQDFFLDHVQQNMQTEAAIKLNEFLSSKGARIEAVLFRDVSLPKLVLNAIKQTKTRQEEVNREEAQLMIVEKKAQAQVKEAEAREQAAVANANAKRTQADAEAYRIEKEAVATGKANKLINASLTSKLIQYNSVDKWDGKYPTTMMSSGTDIMMALPSK